ncbi:MAG: hypothetical protein GX621_12590 [Pirellulaceae bacterium]|nr:hypothetical protein [Pirellulaceae bacterium]
MPKSILPSCVLVATILLSLLATATAVANPYSGSGDPSVAAYDAAGHSTHAAVGSSVPSAGYYPGTGAPEAPTPTTRPEQWPANTTPSGRDQGGATGNPGQPDNAPRAPDSALARDCEDARILGRVGPEVVLAGEVMALFVNHNIEKLKEPIPDEFREELLKNWLVRAIVTKLMFVEAKRSIPSENFGPVEKQIQAYFEKEEVPRLMEKAKLTSAAALEERLALLGTSLEWQKKLYTERTLGQQWMLSDGGFKKVISPEELLAYYRRKASDFDRPARARWEELVVRVSPVTSKQEAWQKLAELGNQVLGGLPFAEAARRGSEGATAAEGGVREWTTRGSLASREIDRALFGLPVGQLSPIIESNVGLHIIRVVEREEARRIPFTEVQEDIREAIQNERFEENFQNYVAKLKDKTRVWTIYDEADAVAKKDSPDAPRTR